MRIEIASSIKMKTPKVYSNPLLSTSRFGAETIYGLLVKDLR
jgi:hypothetical protein